MKKLLFTVIPVILLSWNLGTYTGNEVYNSITTTEITEPTTETTETYTYNIKPKGEDLGVFEIYAYCPCELCSEGYDRLTATGTQAMAGRTIAVDPKVIPYGTKVEICGQTYIAEDCGGDIKGNRIDMFFDTHAETLDWGVRVVNVYKE